MDDNTKLIADARETADAIDKHMAVGRGDASRIRRLADNLEASQPRVIRTVEELPNVVRGSVLRDANGDVFEEHGAGVWMTGEKGIYSWAFVKFPATVLWTPEETGR